MKLSTDYDHSATFVGIKHIPGPRWKLLIPFGTRESRTQSTRKLATEGWIQAPTGQGFSLVAVETTRTK